MPRPTNAERKRLHATMENHVKSGLSTGQIARLLGKSQQAVHQYLVQHGLETRAMRERRENNLDNRPRSSEIEGTT
jgi:predicted transcriptional regulator